MRELVESGVDTVDLTLGLDVVFVPARMGKGRINSLSPEVFSVTRVDIGEAT